MGGEIVSYMFNGQGVRTVQDGAGKVWFVAKDIAEVLEYTGWQPNLIAHVPEKWKGIKAVNTLGGVQQMLALSEEGVYFFLARSDKPKAIPMQEWIAGEVLPAIRAVGGFVRGWVASKRAEFARQLADGGMSEDMSRKVASTTWEDRLRRVIAAMDGDGRDRFDTSALGEDIMAKASEVSVAGGLSLVALREIITEVVWDATGVYPEDEKAAKGPSA